MNAFSPARELVLAGFLLFDGLDFSVRRDFDFERFALSGYE